MNDVGLRMNARWFGFFGILLASQLQAMGTPPQKPAKGVAEASSNAVMLKADEMRAAPDVGANVLARLDKGARVSLLATQGSWRQIGAAGKTGWVRVLSIGADPQSGVGLSDLGSLGRTPQGKVVAVAGVRGLDEDILKSAVFSESEMQLLRTFSMSRGEAEQFALAAGLQVRALPYLDVSKHSNASGAAASAKGN